MKRLFAGLVILLSVSWVWADESEEATERLISLLEQSDHMVANFEQKTYKELAATPVISTGTLKISKPLKFHWSVNTPFEQAVISDGETLWVFDPDLEQATYQAISEDLQQSPAMILAQPRLSLTGQYQVFEVISDELTAYKLYPNDEDSLFSELVLIFSGSTISEIRILDSFGQETVILFTNVTVPDSIPVSVFEFIPPPGTDLFEQM
jgi:outer membrane lipoprotein carrier protein